MSNQPLKPTDIHHPELWDFPMDYPMSILGYAGDALMLDVKRIFAIHVPDFDCSAIQVNASKTGKYHSLRARLHLTSKEQVNQLYAALAAAESIKTVL